MPLLIAMLMVGCKQSTGGTAAVNPVGTYTLVSVDGKAVPCTVSHDGRSPTIKSGSFAINADGTCSSTVVFSIPGRGDSTREVKATYTSEAAKLTMQWQGAGTTTGTIEKDTFTMNNEGMIFVYHR